MIKTTIEWYTLDEKLPFDGTMYGEHEYRELLAIITLTANGINFDTIQPFRYLDGAFGIYFDGDFVDCTEQVKYWAYVPEIGE